MLHDWLVIALSLIVTVSSGLIVRFLRHVDDLEEAKERHSREIRDTRQAISRIEGKLDMDPFPYTSE